MSRQGEPLVSIIIPVYNGRDVIGECLDAVFSIDYAHYEVLIVDDCSVDKSGDFVRGSYPLARVLRTKNNSGFAGAVNSGITNSTGSLVVLLNMDTVVDKGWLTALVNVLLADESVGLAGSKIFSPDRKTLQHAGGLLLENGLSVHIGRGERDEGKYDIPVDVDYLCGASLAFRRSIADELGGFDEGYRPLYYEDTDLAARVRKRGLRVVYVPNSVLVHKENVSTKGLSMNFYFCYHKSRLRFVFKNFSLRDIVLKFFPKEKQWFLAELPVYLRMTLLKVYLISFWPSLSLLCMRFLRKGER